MSDYLERISPRLIETGIGLIDRQCCAFGANTVNFDGFAMYDKGKLPDFPGQGFHDLLGRPLLYLVAEFTDKQQLFMLLT